MFRRSKTDAAPPTTVEKADGKGRPTPSRKEAEAAARARAKAPRTRKEQAAAQRSARGESSRQMRQAMKTGDERYLPTRDKGPVKRFIRDWIDSRFSFVELLVPLLILTMALGYSGNARLMGIGNGLMFGIILLVVVDIFMLRFRLRRELARRFPDAPTKGTTYYAVMRSLQMKFMRMPKPQVKIGQQLPDTYR
ncbi:DUF3043 domain-containing protein [Nocardioides bigeumensis]|uniref:DUF3043 domain-containing protein n=1 Tax=Nocardioides bigeumensis TaxID=433657 RepID=A0ABP5JK58_9ACTN